LCFRIMFLPLFLVTSQENFLDLLYIPARRSSDLRRPGCTRRPATSSTADRSRGCRPGWRSSRATAPCAPSPSAPTGSCTGPSSRSEEHTSELQSRENLVCRLLLEKQN